MLMPVTLPEARIAVEACQPLPAKGQWRVAWRISNPGGESLRLVDAWVPHGRFRGEGHIPLAATVEPGESSVVELNVSAEEPPGSVVENAYLILLSPPWRLFARMRVEFDADASPMPIVETLTFQSIQ
jgi:hypothetical protein